MKFDYEDRNENDINISPVGLINFSKSYQKSKNNKYYKNTYMYNTCYINSSMQCLFRLDDFVKNILKCDKGNLVFATKNLIYSMQNNKKQNNKCCSVLEIKQVMGINNEKYNGNEQQDANEFISNYLNDLVEETKDIGKINWKCLKNDETCFNNFLNKYQKRKGNSFILDLFYGIFRTENYCKYCNYSFTVKFNTFNILEFIINEEKYRYQNKTINMQDLLEEYISEYNNDNEICSDCKRDVKIKTSIYSLPKCLIIFFKRDYTYNNIKKIDILKTLNMEKYIYDKSLNEDKNFFYHLKGVIFYSNYSSKVGHYKSACLVNNEKWYYFDDNRLETDRNLLRIYENDNPVFLFYEK